MQAAQKLEQEAFVPEEEADDEVGLVTITMTNGVNTQVLHVLHVLGVQLSVALTSIHSLVFAVLMLLPCLLLLLCMATAVPFDAARSSRHCTSGCVMAVLIRAIVLPLLCVLALLL